MWARPPWRFHWMSWNAMLRSPSAWPLRRTSRAFTSPSAAPGAGLRLWWCGVEVPLDELERYASQPFGVAIAPDKSRIYVTIGGSECVIVIDVQRLMRFIH